MTRVRRLSPLALITAILIAAWTATSTPASTPRACSRATLRDLVRSHHLLLTGESVDRVICHDFTHDGLADIAFTLFSGGTAGDLKWGVFVAQLGGYRLTAWHRFDYGSRIRRAGNDLLVSNPRYGPSDPNCCPSYFVIARWHFEHGHFKKIALRRSKHGVG